MYKGGSMDKIMVIGCGGAGKSTFSRQLCQILKISVHHLDTLGWQAGWVATPREEFDEEVSKLILNEKWIIDGNYGRTFDVRFEQADTIFFLNMSRTRCLYRVFKRRILNHGKSRPDMKEGCPEKLDFEFIKWVWHYKKHKSPKILEKLKILEKEKKVIVFNKPSEVERFLMKLRTSTVVEY